MNKDGWRLQQVAGVYKRRHRFLGNPWVGEKYDQPIQAIHPEILNHSPRFLMFQFNPFSQNPQNRIKTLNWGSWGFVKEVEVGTRTSKRDFLQRFLVWFKMHNERCNSLFFADKHPDSYVFGYLIFRKQCKTSRLSHKWLRLDNYLKVTLPKTCRALENGA